MSKRIVSGILALVIAFGVFLSSAPSTVEAGSGITYTNACYAGQRCAATVYVGAWGAEHVTFYYESCDWAGGCSYSSWTGLAYNGQYPWGRNITLYSPHGGRVYAVQLHGSNGPSRLVNIFNAGY